MTITPIDWPDVLRPRDFGFFLQNFDVSGGAAPDGTEQFVSSAGPRWGAAMTLDINTTEKVLAVRALRVNTKGRAIPVKLPNFDGRRVSWPVQTFNSNSTGVVLSPNKTRNKNLDGTDFEDPEIPDESEIEAVVTDIALLRATSMTITVSQGGAILAGQQFGIGTRLYEIGTVQPDGAPGGTGAGDYDVTFLPPLRAGVSAGATVLFTRPTCQMRIMNLNDELRKLDTLRFATLNLEFSEYI